MWRAVAPSAVVAAGAMMAFLLGIIAWRLAVDELGRMRDYRLAVQSRADERADELRTSLRLAISTTWSLGTLVSQLGGEPLLDGRVFERIAEALIEASGVGIGNLQLAPNGTVRLIAPLTDSDKPALGHALLVDPLRRAAAVATIRAYPERRVTLAGPLKLLQGSVALLGRHPVFSTQASEFLELGTWTDGQGETHSVDCSTEEARRANCHFRGPDEADGSPTYFWGFVTVLVSVDKLLQGANMDQLSSAGNLTHVYGNDGFEWQLIDEKPHVGFAETNGIFATSNGTNATSPLDDAITSPIEISDLGIAWTLHVRPHGGWQATSAPFTFDVIIVAVLTAVGFVTLGLTAMHNARRSRVRELLELTERQEIEARLSASMAAKEARSSLIRSVMHDLRSPLVAIGIAAAELRAALPGVPERSLPQLVETLSLCAQFSEELLSDMLDWERIEAGRLQLFPTPFRPEQLVANSRATFQHVADAKGIVIRFAYTDRTHAVLDAATNASRASRASCARSPRPSVAEPPPPLPPPSSRSSPLLLVGDAKRVQQCVNNLVSNSIKFTPAGKSVEVDVVVERAPSPEAWMGGCQAVGAVSTSTSASALSACASGPASARSRTLATSVQSSSSLVQSSRSVLAATLLPAACRARVPPGDIDVRAACAPGLGGGSIDGGGVMLVVCVRDEGTGLAPADLAALLDALGAAHDRLPPPSEREPTAGERALVGGEQSGEFEFRQFGEGKRQGNSATGLGLLITRQILQLHSGSIDVASAGLGHGTCTTIRLPMPLAGADPERRDAAALAGDHSHRSQAASIKAPFSRRGTPMETRSGPPRNASSPLSLAVGVGRSSRSGARVAPSAATVQPSSAAAERSSASATVSARAAAAAAAAAAFAARGVYAVLHVDDDQFLRFTVPLSVFNPLGVELVQAEDGVDALERFRERLAAGGTFDAVVVDNQMPRLGGAELVRVLRAELGFAGLIVGLTGDVSGCEDRRRFEESGLDGCYDKHQEGLARLTQLLVEHRDSLQGAGEQAQAQAG